MLLFFFVNDGEALMFGRASFVSDLARSLGGGGDIVFDAFGQAVQEACPKGQRGDSDLSKDVPR